MPSLLYYIHIDLFPFLYSAGWLVLKITRTSKGFLRYPDTNGSAQVSAGGGKGNGVVAGDRTIHRIRLAAVGGNVEGVLIRSGPTGDGHRHTLAGGIVHPYTIGAISTVLMPRLALSRDCHINGQSVCHRYDFRSLGFCHPRRDARLHRPRHTDGGQGTGRQDRTYHFSPVIHKQSSFLSSAQSCTSSIFFSLIPLSIFAHLHYMP